jgi:choline dehydrogenase-like flavoprotein
MSNATYDIIIIGSGAGGGTLVRHLAPSGKSILLLERGDWMKREPENWSAKEVFVKNRYVSSDTWHDKNGKPFQPGATRSIAIGAKPSDGSSSSTNMHR